MFEVTKEIKIDNRYGIDFSNYEKFTKYNNGYAKVYINNKLSYIDKEGNITSTIPEKEITSIVYPPKLTPCSNNLKMGYVNENNDIVIPFIYSYACPFTDKYAIVKKDKWGLINEEGTEILPCNFNEVMYMNENKVYIDKYVYDISKIKLKYLLHISYNDKVVTKEFDSMEVLEFYKKALFDSLFNIVNLTSDEIIDKCMIKKRVNNSANK